MLVYVGDLAPVFDAVRRALAPDGLFAFTVQKLDGDACVDGFKLGADYRFAHSEAYLLETASSAGLDVVHVKCAATRRDAGVDVAGYVVLLAHRSNETIKR